MFIAAVVVVGFASVWWLWDARSVLQAALTGEIEPTLAYSDFLAGVELADDLDRAYLGLAALAGILFVTWLWFVRRNSEWLSDATHSRARGWVIGSWICPVVNLWFPYQVVRDVWRASDPETRMAAGALARVRGRRLVGWWWACVITSALISRYAFSRFDKVATFEGWTGLVVATTFAYLLLAVAGVLIIVAVRQINRWQGPSVERVRAGLAVPR